MRRGLFLPSPPALFLHLAQVLLCTGSKTFDKVTCGLFSPRALPTNSYPPRQGKTQKQHRCGQQAFARMAKRSTIRPVAIAHSAQQLKPVLVKPPVLPAGTFLP